MSGVPADVLATRVVAALERAVIANDAGQPDAARDALVATKHWLDKLREAL